MAKGEGAVPYLTRLTQIRDELGVVGSKTEDEELVRINVITTEPVVKLADPGN